MGVIDTVIKYLKKVEKYLKKVDPKSCPNGNPGIPLF